MLSNKRVLALCIVAASMALATVGRADNISFVHTSANTKVAHTGNFFVADVAGTDDLPSWTASVSVTLGLLIIPA